MHVSVSVSVRVCVCVCVLCVCMHINFISIILISYHNYNAVTMETMWYVDVITTIIESDNNTHTWDPKDITVCSPPCKHSHVEVLIVLIFL